MKNYKTKYRVGQIVHFYTQSQTKELSAVSEHGVRFLHPGWEYPEGVWVQYEYIRPLTLKEVGPSFSRKPPKRKVGNRG